MESELYKENILDHYRNPRNKRNMPGATFHHKELHVFCGDEIELFVRLGTDDAITEVSFEGTGCAVSQAAASLLMDALVGKRAHEIIRMGIVEIQELLGITLSASRVPCALLALRAFQNGWRMYYGTR